MFDLPFEHPLTFNHLIINWLFEQAGVGQFIETEWVVDGEQLVEAWFVDQLAINHVIKQHPLLRRYSLFVAMVVCFVNPLYQLVFVSDDSIPQKKSILITQITQFYQL